MSSLTSSRNLLSNLSAACAVRTGCIDVSRSATRRAAFTGYSSAGAGYVLGSVEVAATAPTKSTHSDDLSGAAAITAGILGLSGT